MPIHKKSLVVFLVLAVAIISGSVYGFYEESQVETLDTGAIVIDSEEKTEKSDIIVYVCGAVNKPAVIKIKADARVIDAVEMCGGTVPTADTTKINMAQPLKDGMQIVVPEKLVMTTAENRGAEIQKKVEDGKININTADVSELDKLPGIGPATAAAILEYRKNEGQFQNVEDLKKVNGIGEAKYKRLADKITI